MNKEPLKILMVETANMNLGDSILADNDYFLIKKAVHPKKVILLRYSISSRDIGQIKYVDAVIFAGGIIKSTNEKFWLYIPKIINEAQKYQVPVFLSAIGAEKFYPDDEKSRRLKEALNLPCVKGISVRDDIELLKNDYIINKEIKLYSVYDPAVWCAKTYKKELGLWKFYRNEKKIGLGIVRHKLFSDYGNPQIDKDFQLNFWKEVIDELEKKQLPWVLFTNGDTYDEQFADEVLAYVGHGEKLKTPLDGVEVVRNIAKFSGVIAGRMHSNIVAYSLGIASIGFVWNKKLRFWSEKIGAPERFLSCDQMIPALAVERLLCAMEEKKFVKQNQKDTVYDAIKDFVQHHCTKRQAAVEDIDFKKSLVAPALGAIAVRYKNTNSPEAFEHALKNGYRIFQLDLRLTEDHELVCVNRWHKDTFKMMNLGEQATPGKPLCRETFSKCRYYNRFHTMDMEHFLAISSNQIKRKDIKVILAFGKPDKEDALEILHKLKNLLSQYGAAEESFFIKLERKGDVEILEQSGMKMKIIYHAVDPQGTEEESLQCCKKALEYCKHKKIRYMSVSSRIYNEEVAALCRAYAVKTYVTNGTKGVQCIEHIKKGAAFTDSHYYGPEYLQSLTKQR